MKINYIPTIGLEIHAELKTRTKMFCGSKNDPDETRPNVNVCPVCMAHPGTLPVINKEAVRHMVRVGVAVGGEIADFTEFDRKNYFYPDIPKGYQISQYKYPIVSGGSLAGVELTRVHLEEDTARSIHVSTSPQNNAECTRNYAEDARSRASIPRNSASSPHESATLVDFNRAGIPLMELVTEPVIHDAEIAVKFARELQLLLRYLGASDANMEKGELRVEANVSISPRTETFASADMRGTHAEERGKSARKRALPRNSASSLRESATLGTKVEVKNLNSFRVVGKAIEYEIKRQTKALENGEEIVQETRGWDESKGETFSQRRKETSDDYRYFPDPDLPKLKLSEIEEFKNITLPELPQEKRERYKAHGITDEAAQILVGDTELGTFFEEAAKQGLAQSTMRGAGCTLKSSDVSVGAGKGEALVKRMANYITSDIAGLGKGPGKLTPESFVALIKMNADDEVSSRGVKDILAALIEEGGDARKMAEEKNLFQKSDEGELSGIVEKIISENPDAASGYKAGNEKLLQFLVGQGMQISGGSANPQILSKLLEEKLR